MLDFRSISRSEAWSEGEDSDLAIIGPVDTRVHETRTMQFPWNTLVHLCRDFGTGACAGCTGTLIGPRRILTAAHCLGASRELELPGASSPCPAAAIETNGLMGRSRHWNIGFPGAL